MLLKTFVILILKTEKKFKVFYLNELITEFDANINHEIGQLHLIDLNFNSNLNAATEQIQENLKLINELVHLNKTRF